MLRTCNIVRIAHFPVLRKDGALRRDDGRWTGDGGRGTGAGRGNWAWIASRGSQRRRTAPGNHPAACGRHPSTEGIRTRVWTGLHRCKPSQPTSNPYPLCGGVPPQGRGGSPRRARHLIFDI
ncbi:MAG: hypothetical protein LBM98_04310 [Oscillospiraceae bacterium]|nr:hypothetical protein [Oscillospiraceae bacterium]